MNTQTEQNKPLANEQDRMVPLPSHSIVPQRDVDKAPILETHHLGIDFGGLTAVEELTIAIGPTEISGLIGPNGAGKTKMCIRDRLPCVALLRDVFVLFCFVRCFLDLSFPFSSFFMVVC